MNARVKGITYNAQEMWFGVTSKLGFRSELKRMGFLRKIQK